MTPITEDKLAIAKELRTRWLFRLFLPVCLVGAVLTLSAMALGVVWLWRHL